MINVEKESMIDIGSLGKIQFPKGYYVYIGSAQNSLEKRIHRHCSKNKKIRWHIDYLVSKNKVKITNVYFKIAGKAEECKTAQKIADISTAEPIKGFGSSDCRCMSHLFRLSALDGLKALEMEEFK